MNQPTKPLSMDEILKQGIKDFFHPHPDYVRNDYAIQDFVDQAKTHLIELVENLPELQEKTGIVKGTPEWRNGDTCSDCQMVYMAELGSCLCDITNQDRGIIKQALIKAIKGDKELYSKTRMDNLKRGSD